MNGTYIYALRDPRDGRVFYVGKSSRLFMRYADHCSGRERSKNPMRLRYISDLRAQGFKPILHILERCPDDLWQSREIFWIAEFRRLAHPLCNSAPGGNGGRINLRQNPESIKKRARANRGKKRTEEVKARIAASNVRTWSKVDLLARHRLIGKMSAKKLWENISPERKKQMADAVTSYMKERWRNNPEKERANLEKMHQGQLVWVRSLSPEKRRENALKGVSAGRTPESRRKKSQSAKLRWVNLSKEQRSEYWKKIHPRGNVHVSIL